MIDFLDKYKYWLMGGAGGLGALWFLFGRVPSQPQPATGSTAPQPKVTTPSAQPMPLFIAGAGSPLPAMSASPAATIPLGEEVWMHPDPQLAENPDYAIAQINASVAMAQIDAQKEIAKSLLGSGSETAPPPPSTTPTAPPMSQMVNELAGALANGSVNTGNPASLLPVYEYALKYDLPASTVAQGFNLATNGATNFSGSDINAYIQQYLGQKPLK